MLFFSEVCGWPCPNYWQGFYWYLIILQIYYAQISSTKSENTQNTKLLHLNQIPNDLTDTENHSKNISFEIKCTLIYAFENYESDWIIIDDYKSITCCQNAWKRACIKQACTFKPRFRTNYFQHIFMVFCYKNISFIRDFTHFASLDVGAVSYHFFVALFWH